jgi:hypothetical protein
MQKAWLAARTWFLGKKTYIGAFALAATGVLGVATGKLSVTDGFGLVSAGFAVSGLAAKLDRHHGQVMDAVVAAAGVGVAIRTHSPAAIKVALQPLESDALAAAVAESTAKDGATA